MSTVWVGMERANLPVTVSLVADAETGEKTTVVFCPQEHGIYTGNTLTGRGTSVIGGREEPPPDPAQFSNAVKLREGNDIVVKIYCQRRPRQARFRSSRRQGNTGKGSTSMATTSRRWFATWIRIFLAARQRRSFSSSVSTKKVPVACASWPFGGYCQSSR